MRVAALAIAALAAAGPRLAAGGGVPTTQLFAVRRPPHAHVRVRFMISICIICIICIYMSRDACVRACVPMPCIPMCDVCVAYVRRVFAPRART